MEQSSGGVSMGCQPVLNMVGRLLVMHFCHGRGRFSAKSFVPPRRTSHSPPSTSILTSADRSAVADEIVQRYCGDLDDFAATHHGSLSVALDATVSACAPPCRNEISGAL